MDSDADEYEPTDSEQEYNEEEREILDGLREQRKQNAKRKDQKQEVLAFSDDSDDDDDDENGNGNDNDDDDLAELMRDSDIEGAEDNDDDLPDTMNWGNKKSTYYNTDFIDQDYSSYNAQEEDMALAEEEEAKKIQLRLAKQMREADFGLDNEQLDTDDTDKDDDDDDNGDGDDDDSNAVKKGGSIKVISDLTGLNDRERMQLLQKDSPELLGLIQDIKQHLVEVEQLTAPVIDYVHKNEVPLVPALQFASLYQNLLLTYCSNVTFYLLLKSKRASVKSHPVIKRLVQLKQLRDQLTSRYHNYIRPQLEALLERINDGDTITVLPIQERKSKLKILDQFNDQNQTADNTDDEDDEEEEAAAPEEDNDNNDDDEGEDVERRGITYQMAKNKGLMPHRKKELRNPRVKHRGKYRKALIRRKGAVRTVRKELKRYGGEVSGIKASVTKSVKFKS